MCRGVMPAPSAIGWGLEWFERVRGVRAARYAQGVSGPKSFPSPRTRCAAFANFSSIGSRLAASAALVPERRHDLARLGLRAMLAGTFANFLTATIAGMLL